MAGLVAASLVFGAGTCLDERPARAQAAASPAAPPLVAEIDVGSSGLDPERLRAAIEHELGVTVRARTASEPAGALAIRVGDRRSATVRFQSTPSRALERTLELPADPERAYETIALLTGNLARNEASELIEELRRSRAPSPEPAAPDTDEEPPPAETAAKPPERPAPPAPRPAPKKRPPPAPKPRDDTKPALARAPVNLTFFFPLALYRDVDRRRVGLELGFVYSRVGAIGGAGLALGVSRVDGPVTGAQIAVGGVLGYGDLDGAALAVGFNHRRGTTTGVQGAVGYNYTDRLDGAELALVNVAGGEAPNYGFQGGLVNVTGPLSGAQIGLVNVAQRVKGAQIALVNVGGEIDGTAIGLVNVADRVDGLALGLVNVVGNARTRLAAWADSSGRANLGIKYRQDWLFTMLSAAYRMNRAADLDGELVEPAFAIGGHAEFGKSFVELDVQYAFRGESVDQLKEQHIARYRLSAGFDPVKAFGVFAGGALEQKFDRDGSSVGALGFAGIQVF